VGVLYLATYNVADAPRAPQEPTNVCRQFINAVNRSRWPYDVGDDPSFFCARHFAEGGGALTWGICRRPLRCCLREGTDGPGTGDTVAFFAHQVCSGGLSIYRFSGFATVARKVSQTAIYLDDSLKVYRHYLNLLIRPGESDGFEHCETHPGKPHSDWLWRMVSRSGHRWKSKDFEPFRSPKGRTSFQPRIDMAGNQLIELDANYVIFSREPDETCILDNPPLVAQHKAEWGLSKPEKWLETAEATRIWELTLGRCQHRRKLMICSKKKKTRGQPRHPHVRITTIDAAEWRHEIREDLKSLDLQPLPAAPKR
jgi:hypothetical protein